LVALEPIAKGEDIIALPNSCTAFDASAAREDKDLGLATAIAAYESSPTRGGRASPLACQLCSAGT